MIEKIEPGSKTPFREGDEVLGKVWGSFAEYALVPLKDLVRKPRAMGYAVAASTRWEATPRRARGPS